MRNPLQELSLLIDQLHEITDVCPPESLIHCRLVASAFEMYLDPDDDPGENLKILILAASFFAIVEPRGESFLIALVRYHRNLQSNPVN